jgi:hypothetical protein
MCKSKILQISKTKIRNWRSFDRKTKHKSANWSKSKNSYKCDFRKKLLIIKLVGTVVNFGKSYEDKRNLIETLGDYSEQTMGSEFK